MPKLSKRELLILALRARGYTSGNYNPMVDVEQVFSISPADRRRLSDSAIKVIIADFAVYIATSKLYTLQKRKAMPKAMKQTLYSEGTIIAKRLISVKTLEDLGL